jgi:hypothetical protein
VRSASLGNGERMVAVRDFSGLLSWPWALASAVAIAPMVSLEWCIGGLRIHEVEAGLVAAHNYPRVGAPKKSASRCRKALRFAQGSGRADLATGLWGNAVEGGRPKFAVDPLPAMPSQEPQRTAEAVQARASRSAQVVPLRSARRYAKRPRNSRHHAEK